MNPSFSGSVTNFKVRLWYKCLINCSSGLRDLNVTQPYTKPGPPTVGVGARPPTVGVQSTPSVGGRGVHALRRWAWGHALHRWACPRPRGGTPQPRGGVISYLRPSGRVRARSSSRVYARYNSVRLLGRTTRRPAPSSYECPVRRRAALFVSAARLTNVPVLCARRAISSQSSAQGQVNRSVHHHHRSESREVF